MSGCVRQYTFMSLKEALCSTASKYYDCTGKLLRGVDWPDIVNAYPLQLTALRRYGVFVVARLSSSTRETHSSIRGLLFPRKLSHMLFADPIINVPPSVVKNAIFPLIASDLPIYRVVTLASVLDSRDRLSMWGRHTCGASLIICRVCSL